jgi:16S rRNA (guanine527-N7)-methyltransferase
MSRRPARARSRAAASSSARPIPTSSQTSRRDPRLSAWVSALVSTPGLTSVVDPEEAWRLHVDDALAAAPFVERGPVADVGSGGGSPGIPLAAAFPRLSVVLLEANRRRCEFLRSEAKRFPNVEVVCARAEEHARSRGRDAYATVVTRALAAPPVAAEWCLPLVAPGGRMILFAGEPELDRVATVSALLGGASPQAVPVQGMNRRCLVLVEKIAATPSGFPRRPGLARKRPLA